MWRHLSVVGGGVGGIQEEENNSQWGRAEKEHIVGTIGKNEF